MKKYLIRRVLTTNLALLFFAILHAQDSLPYDNPAYGPDSASRIRCAAELSTMSEYIKIKLYDYALPSWRKVFNDCPGASKNIYISGVKIFRDKIARASSPEEKSAYFDTLMMNYDRRIQYFGQEGYVLGRKGIDIIRYNDKDYDMAYEAFLRSTQLSGTETDVNVLLGLTQTGAVMMKAGSINGATFLENYLMMHDLLSQMLAKGENPSRVNRASEMIDKVIIDTGIPDCAVIENVLAERIHNSNPENGLLQLTSKLLANSGCDNTAFYAEVTGKIFEISPDPDKAWELARYNIRQEQFEKAAGYLEKAIDTETDAGKKANYQYQLALILSTKLGRYAEAKTLAEEALNNKPGWGEPYFLLANAVINGINECNAEDFDRKAIYWLAVDYCNKAKSVDPASEKKANDLIGRYTANFPSVEDSFFRSLKAGDPYRFDCWIKESTTVKEK